MLYRSLIASFFAALLAGCAIHPLPENVTGIDTPDIVRQIRCESREAVIHEVKRWLTSLAGADGDRIAQLRAKIAQQLLAKYDADPESISSFNANVFPRLLLRKGNWSISSTAPASPTRSISK